MSNEEQKKQTDDLAELIGKLGPPPDYISDSDSEKAQESDDDTMPVDDRSGSIEDVYIAVMGVTGAGKSSFIELCTGKKGLRGHGLTSCTNKVTDYSFMHRDKSGKSLKIHLIDTPGFDDTNRGDTAVLKDIATWLGETYKKRIRLSGVLYLHRIIDVRMAGSAKRNLLMFIELCGPNCFKHVVLATTMWSVMKDRAEAERREKELVQTFWSHMRNQGSQVARHEGGRGSALAILGIIIDNREKIVLQIQHEIVENGMQLDQTAAGSCLDKEIRAERRKHKQEMKELERQKQEALEKQDEVARAAIAEMQKQKQKEIEEATKASKGLQANYEKLQQEQQAEIARLTQATNDNIQKFERKAKELQELEEKVKSGQGSGGDNAAMLELEKRVIELGKKIDVQRDTTVRREKSVESGVGKIIFGAMLPWPINAAYQVANHLMDRERAKNQLLN